MFVDDKSAIPAPIFEALAAKVPVITHSNRFLENYPLTDSIILTETNDDFELADVLASFCDKWVGENTKQFKTTNEEVQNVLKLYTEKEVKGQLIEIFNLLQEEKVKTFTAIEKLIEEGKIDK